MYEIFNNAPSNTWFDSMSRITKNLDSKHGRNIRVYSTGLSAEGVASTEKNTSSYELFSLCKKVSDKNRMSSIFIVRLFIRVWRRRSRHVLSARKLIYACTSAGEFYGEVWRRMILFYGDNLVRLESYYNSVLVGKISQFILARCYLREKYIQTRSLTRVAGEKATKYSTAENKRELQTCIRHTQRANLFFFSPPRFDVSIFAKNLIERISKARP